MTDEEKIRKCPICGMTLCRHGVHPGDECYQCEASAPPQPDPVLDGLRRKRDAERAAREEE